MINEESVSSFRVYIEDTDLMGIIYHARYLYFFERARTDLLRNNNITLTAMAEKDTYFAIRDAHIRYLFPGRLDDVLTIRSVISKMKGCRLEMQQEMFNQENKLLASLNTQVVIVDKDLKPKRGFC